MKTIFNSYFDLILNSNTAKSKKKIMQNYYYFHAVIANEIYIILIPYKVFLFGRYKEQTNYNNYIKD
jgi:hypothetical protein